MQVSVDGRAIPEHHIVRAVEVRRAVNRIPTATLVIGDGDPARQCFEGSQSSIFEPGKAIEIRAGYEGKRERLFRGVIVRHSIKVPRRGASQLRLICKDVAVRMTLARRDALFTERKDSEVMRLLLGVYDLDAEIADTSVTHPQLVQHDCTDWDLLVTRAEANGMVVVVEDGTVRIGEPKTDGDATLGVGFGESILDLDLDIDATAQAESIACRAWDPATQAVLDETAREPRVNQQGNLDGGRLAAGAGADLISLRTFADKQPEELKLWADGFLRRMRIARICGRATFPGDARAKPDTLLRLEHLGNRFNGDAYLSGITHLIERGDWTTRVDIGLSPRSFSDSHREMEGPAAGGLVPPARGLQIATVVQSHEDPDGAGRVLVSLPCVGGDTRNLWVRLAQPYASKDAGFCFFPEPGDEVVIGFLGEDPSSPVLLGGLHSKPRQPPCTPDEGNRRKSIATAGQLKIVFDDGEGRLRIETPEGRVVELDDEAQRVSILDGNANKVVMSKDGITLESEGDIRLSSKGKIQLNAAGNLTLDSGANLEAAAQKVSAEAVQTLGIKSARAQLEASGTMIIKGGLVNIN
ncbi:type VI secretion system tip protein VgrG [Thiocapsa marina]|uniref:Rhs element Vgr protein n=1 Tax=Thiocapsa marina 5811 TaxID=768671 RepID=F9U9K9_9GAMM|nr:type VI secretion system tip protein VgrG [Thiocapsa marina]EGV18807.1 Rhs element Vgr protein [Thiocapsa marina 5811]